MLNTGLKGTSGGSILENAECSKRETKRFLLLVILFVVGRERGKLIKRYNQVLIIVSKCPIRGYLQ